MAIKIVKAAAKKARKLSRDKARQDMAVVGKRAEDLKSTLQAKEAKLQRLRKEKAEPDVIEREVAAIEGIKKKLGPINLRQVKEKKAKPLPPRPEPKARKPKDKPTVSLRNAYENAKNANKKNFTFEGTKYNVDTLKERFAKADKAAGLKKGGMAKKSVPVITVGVGMMPTPKGKKPRTGSKDFRNGGMVMSSTSNLKPVPSGNKGKGLRALPKSVRNNMGFMKKGGMIKK